jgi:hypothetical protein
MNAPAPKPEKPLESFQIDRDPLTGWEIEPAPQPQYRKCIPVYDRDSGELREFIL